MSHEQVLTEEGSHYEVSLTAGQAFVAFVLLLLSLAASFAFGLLIGKGQDDRTTARRDAAIVNEAATTSRSAELAPVPAAAHRGNSGATPEEPRATPLIQETSDPSPLETAVQKSVSNEATTRPSKTRVAAAHVAPPTDFQTPTIQTPIERHPASMAQGSVPAVLTASTHASNTAAAPTVPYYAQLMSTSDQKSAEALAAKLIDSGFTGAYVERGTGPKGAAFRVRVKFPSEVSARAAVDGLKPFSKDVWVTKQP
jgi:hypothetical protein